MVKSKKQIGTPEEIERTAAEVIALGIILLITLLSFITWSFYQHVF
jgi:hypothetical protein